MSVRAQVNYSVQFFPAWFMMCVSTLHLRRKHPSSFTPLHLLCNTNPLLQESPNVRRNTSLFGQSFSFGKRERRVSPGQKPPVACPNFLTQVFSASEVACQQSLYISLIVRHNPTEDQHQSKQDPVGNIPTMTSLVYATHTSLCRMSNTPSPPRESGFLCPAER